MCSSTSFRWYGQHVRSSRVEGPRMICSHPSPVGRDLQMASVDRICDWFCRSEESTVPFRLPGVACSDFSCFRLLESPLSARFAPELTGSWFHCFALVGQNGNQCFCETPEALVDAFGPGARALRMAMWHTHACNVECVNEHDSTTIRLCRAYKHLGSIVSIQANMSPEVLARTSCRQSCFQGAIRAPVLSAPNNEQLTKNAALSSFVLSRFVHLTPTWPKLNGTQVRKMEGTCRNLARVTSGCPCP